MRTFFAYKHFELNFCNFFFILRFKRTEVEKGIKSSNGTNLEGHEENGGGGNSLYPRGDAVACGGNDNGHGQKVPHISVQPDGREERICETGEGG